MFNLYNCTYCFLLISILFIFSKCDKQSNNNSIVASETKLVVDYLTNIDSFTIVNTGTEAASFSFSNGFDFISLSPQEGVLETNKQSTIYFEVDRNFLENGTKQGLIEILTNDRVSDELPFEILHSDEIIWRIEDVIIEAMYSKALNKIIARSHKAEFLKIYDPENQQIDSIALNDQSNCFDIDDQGNFAFVGFDTYFTKVDLINKTTVQSYSMSCGANDIIYSNNNWVYIMPNDSWFSNQNPLHVRCIDLNNGNEIIGPLDIPNNGGPIQAKLNNQSNSLYGYTPLSSPGCIYKNDISNNYAQYQFSFCYDEHIGVDNIWTLKNGDFFIVSNGDIFTSSNLIVEDLKLHATLGSIECQIVSIIEQTSENKLYVIHGPCYSSASINKLNIYNNESFELLESKQMPNIVSITENSYSSTWSNTHFAFMNVEETKIYSVVTPRLNSDNFGIMTYYLD